MKRNVYLRMKPLAEARAAWLSAFDWASLLGSEEVSVAEAVGRVLAEPVHAALSAPSYHGAAMDGIAVRSRETFGASEAAPLDLVVGRDAHFVNTGEVLPEGTDAVIMIEQVQQLDESSASHAGFDPPPARRGELPRRGGGGPEHQRLRIEAPAFPWQHVRRVGEDIVATEMLFARHHRVTPTCAGALMAGGVFRVPVRRRPRVVVIPTGPELVDPEDVDISDMAPGTIVEFNSTVLGKLVEEAGGEWVRHPRLPDDLPTISRTLREAAEEHDLVLVIGGSSAGAADFTRAAIEQTGEVLVHGITMMPGKPTLLARVEGHPVVGVPGYPVSAILCFEQLVAPAMAAMLGAPPPQRPVIEALPTRKIASKLGMEEFVRVRMGRVGERLVATPLPRGAGTVSSFTRADGLLRVPAELEGLHALEPVPVELLRPLEAIEHNVVAVGSHDLTLDVIADLLRARGSEVSLSSTHVGSLGGLMAIRNGVAHLGGSHLLDPTDGSYNTSFVRRYLPDTPVRLVHLARREQGLIVLPGNPKGIGDIGDLLRDDVTFVNRQGGSGTRVLLDYELERRGIEGERIHGYTTEEFTHMAVAVAVLSGAADAGLGILGAANALGLDFVPVVTEEYDLVIPEAFTDHPGVREVLDVIASAEFRQRVEALGGYGLERTGEVR